MYRDLNSWYIHTNSRIFTSKLIILSRLACLRWWYQNSNLSCLWFSFSYSNLWGGKAYYKLALRSNRFYFRSYN